jgi:hypothetical protein
LIHEPPALGRIAAHDVQVVGAEEHSADARTKLSFAPDGRSIHANGARAPGRRDLDLDERAPAERLDLAAHERRGRAVPDERLRRRRPRRGERQQVEGAFEEIRLPLAVGPDRHHHAVRRDVRQPRVPMVAEVAQLEPEEPQARRYATGAGSRTGMTR